MTRRLDEDKDFELKTRTGKNGLCLSFNTHHRPQLVVDPPDPSKRRLVLKHLITVQRRSVE